jgi:glycosyltransferase involved in cell wall biosynthesis
MSALRLAIDARELAGQPTGVGAYLYNLLDRWLQRRDVEITLFAHRTLAHLPAAAQHLVKIVTLPSPTGGTVWEQGTLPRALARGQFDVLFSPAYTTPLFTRVPRVVAIHDVSFAARPEWFKEPERTRRRVVTAIGARRARAVLTVSQFSAREIEERLRVPRERIHTVYHGAPPRAVPLPQEAREPVVAFVGSILNRRRVPDLIAAFELVADARPEARLVLAGADRTWPPQDIAARIAASPHRRNIQWLDYATREQIDAVLRTASAFAFLSEYEGFALTPLEALAHGVPPVLLDTPVAREVYGGCASFVQTRDIQGTAAALFELLNEPTAREERVEHAAPLFERYDWKRTADGTLRVLMEAAG